MLDLKKGLMKKVRTMKSTMVLKRASSRKLFEMVGTIASETKRKLMAERR